MKGSTHFYSGLFAATGILAAGVFVRNGLITAPSAATFANTVGGLAQAEGLSDAAVHANRTLRSVQEMTGFTLPTVIAMLAGTSLGAILPDIDSETSILGKLFPFISGPLRHRTVTHSLLFAAALWGVGGLFSAGSFTVSWAASETASGPTAAALAAAINRVLSLLTALISLSTFFSWLAVGCLLHLALDMLNPAGVPLLWPLRKKFRFPFARLHSGGPVDCFLGRFFWISSILFAAASAAGIAYGAVPFLGQ